MNNSFNQKLPDDSSDSEERVIRTISDYLKSYLTRRRRALVYVVLSFGLGNLLVPKFLMGFSYEGMDFFFVGALATEIGLLAASAALSGRSWYDTIAVCSVLMVFLCASYIVGLNLGSPGMPMEAAVFLFVTGFSAFFVTFACLRVVRRLRRLTLGHVDVPVTDHALSRAISIRFIMLATAAIALSICVVRWSLPDRSQGWPPQVYGAAIVCAFITIESILLFYACLTLMLSRTFSQWSIGILFILFFSLPPLTALLVQLLTRQLIWQFIPQAYAYHAGIVFFSTIALLVLRLAGYRLSAD